MVLFWRFIFASAVRNMTFSLLIYYIKYPFKLWMYELIDQWLIFTIEPQEKKKILIYRLDLIGDYLVSRPFFKSLKDDPKYAGYQFAFAGNQSCKVLAEWLDAEVFEDFIWIDRPRFINSLGYRFRVLKSIREASFERVIYPSHTRQYWLESVVRVSGAIEKITGESIGKYMNSWELALTQSRYSRIIPTGTEPLFEFFRNRNFFSSLTVSAGLIENLKTNFPLLNVEIHDFESDFIVLAPGASTQNRRWPLAKFVALVREIWIHRRVEVVVIGSPGEIALGSELQTLLGPSNVHNLAGKLSLPQSMILLQNAKLLISNESAPVHMAATTGTPTICISQGNHFGRWNPYPESVAPWIRTVYPPFFEKLSSQTLAELYHDGSNVDIDEITVEQVQAVVLKVFY